MSPAAQSRLGRVRVALERVFRGHRDTRLRASFRVLLAGAGIVLVQEPASVALAGILDLEGRLGFGLIQAAVFGVILLAFAAVVDRRPVGEYGCSWSGRWFLDGVVGFLAVLVGFATWLGVAAALGWIDVTVRAATLDRVLLVGLVSALGGTVLNVWVQETTFVAMVLRNAAEGLASRGFPARRAVVAAWVVAVCNFTVVHRPADAGRAVNLLLVLGLYGLLYVQTGELAIPIGVHAGVNYVGGVLITGSAGTVAHLALLELNSSLSGPLGSLRAGAVPQVAIASLVVLGWLRLRGRSLGVQPAIARWTER